MTLSAARAALVNCHVCSQLSPTSILSHGHAHCPRCGAPLHLRKPYSIQRTWALLLAAIILYIPANVFPIMRVVSLGQTQSDTILSGVIHLWQVDMYPLAIIVFVASVFVPMVKLMVLLYLLLSVQFKWRHGLRERTALYRFTEAIGRWSMVDVFVVSLLAALVHLGQIATIIPGPAALAFATVVVLTMSAAMTFDPRLMWDIFETAQDPQGTTRHD
ncbi:MAG: paraquat-inducible protein A [Gammaproteobacteria bacterium]